MLYAYAATLKIPTVRAADQLRDRAGLGGALARPRFHAEYGDADLAMQAAVLAHGIAEGQYFVEGNKRTALVALITFLTINGIALTADQETRERWIIGLAEGLTPEQLADEIRACST